VTALLGKHKVGKHKDISEKEYADFLKEGAA